MIPELAVCFETKERAPFKCVCEVVRLSELVRLSEIAKTRNQCELFPLKSNDPVVAVSLLNDKGKQ